MRERLEEEPEPEPEEPEEAPAPSTTSLVPTVAPNGGREFEYRTDLVTVAEVIDGTTLAERLTKASADGWDLVDIIDAGDRHAVLLRRTKRSDQTSRPVGFAPPRP